MSETKKDEVVDHFNTYEDYLNMFVTEEDMLYLGEEEIARLIVELGYRSSGTLSREKFFQTKAELSAARSINNKQDVDEDQDGSNKQDVANENTDSLLSVIKDRFSSNLDNSVHSIIFLGLVQENGVEISGFIDLAQRIKKENFLPYLTGQKRLKPRQGDLSFANLTKRKSRLCSSENWKVLSEDDSQPAINFEHKITGRKVSSLWVIGDQNIDDGSDSNKCDSWKEIKTDSKRIKIMCFDECLT